MSLARNLNRLNAFIAIAPLDRVELVTIELPLYI